MLQGDGKLLLRSMIRVSGAKCLGEASMVVSTSGSKCGFVSNASWVAYRRLALRAVGEWMLAFLRNGKLIARFKRCKVT